ncbi:MAG: hypothetical protein ACFFFT_15270 [Candidatus Thorarchaeota archaeon]
MKTFIEFDKSNAKFFIDYYIEEYKIYLRIPIEIEDIALDRIIILNKLDFSNRILLVSII